MNNLTPQDRKTLDNFRGMTVGQIFVRARDSQNVTIEQVATYLNIGLEHLQAIENDDVKTLPPKVYAVGFVRAYADLLQLDSEKMAYLFKVQCYGQKQIDEQKKIVRPEGKKIEILEIIKQKADMIPMLLVSVVGSILMLSILVIFVIWLMSDDNSERMIVPDVPTTMLPSEEEPETPATQAANFIAVQTDDAAPPIEPMDIILKPDTGAKSYGASPLEAELAFKFTDAVWAEFRTIKDGKVLLSQKFEKGDVFFVPQKNDVLVTTGNAASIEAYLDNQSLGLIGKQAEIVRLRPFSVQALRLQ